MTLWGSRFTSPPDPRAARLNDSLSFDRRLWREDIDGSEAWVAALEAAGLLDAAERQLLMDGFTCVRREFELGQFIVRDGDEDIHTAVERRLAELVGEVAGKLHTGRSRNDQVATDLRLWVMRACDATADDLAGLVTAILTLADTHAAAPMPGYTHLRQAQPVTFGHWLMSHAWPLLRDRQRFTAVRRATAVLPLGSGALSGAPFPIDRRALATALGFEEVAPNSIDAVGDRDFACGFLYAAALTGVHLSRLAEQLILFSSEAFAFVELGDAWATGSSLMPQKRNPDPLELARGRAGTLIGRLAGLLSTLKGLPSAYDKDLQEDKKPVFEARDTLADLLPVVTGLVGSLRVDPARLRNAIRPEIFATEVADYLVRKGIPFRAAHTLAGRAVRRAAELETRLADLPPGEWRLLSDQFEADVKSCFDLDAALARRAAEGGTAPVEVRRQIESARRALAGE